MSAGWDATTYKHTHKHTHTWIVTRLVASDQILDWSVLQTSIILIRVALVRPDFLADSIVTFCAAQKCAGRRFTPD